MAQAAHGPSRTPGWPEIAAAAVTYAVLLAVLPGLVVRLSGDDATVRGLALGALSGVLGILAFLAAFLLRIRAWRPFGVRRPSGRAVLAGLALGLVAVVVARILTLGVVLIAPDLLVDPQGDYRSSAGSGPLGLALGLLFLAVLTPIGEELAFRGVLTTALGRYGAWVAVIGSTAVFALAHGINLALVPAVVVGLIAALLLRRTGSVVPGMLVHGVNNGVGLVLGVLLAPAAG